jgi:hypothetical protein
LFGEYDVAGLVVVSRVSGACLRDTSVKDIALAIKDLAPDEIREILEPIRLARRIQELENKRQPFQYPTPPSSAFRPPPQQNNRPAPSQPRTRDNGYQPRPQQTEQPPQADEDYQAAMRDWEHRFGAETVPTLQTGYPLTPNTSVPGTGECFKCGHRGHQKKDCKSETMIPYKEGTYRYLVYVSKQAERSQAPPVPAAPPNTAIVALGLVQAEDDSEWPHTAEFANNEYLEPGKGNGYLL